MGIFQEMTNAWHDALHNLIFSDQRVRRYYNSEQIKASLPQIIAIEYRVEAKCVSWSKIILFYVIQFLEQLIRENKVY